MRGKARSAGGFLLAATLAGACAEVPRRPLDPAATEQQLRERSLADPRLRELCVGALGASAKPWPPAELDLATLALAAWLFRPEMAAARSRIASAERSAEAAGRLPNPGLTVTPGRVTHSDASSPWIVTAALDLTIPIGGKREKLRAVADQEIELARLDAAAVAWRTYAEVRDALIERIAAADRLYALDDESRHRAQRLQLVQQRVDVGFAPRGELQTARLESDRNEDELAQAVATLAVAEARLAAATGLLTLAAAKPTEPEFTEATLEGRVVDRLDVRRALAAYEATERALELELARRWPDLHLGPGWEYDQGERKYLLGVGLELPLFDHNEAGIATALARRDESAAEFQMLQAAAIGEMAIAQRSLEAMRQRVKTVHGPMRERVQEQVATAIQSFRAGASDALAVADAELAFALHLRAAGEAKHAWLRAQAEWEDATQRPIDPRVAALAPPSTGDRAAEGDGR